MAKHKQPVSAPSPDAGWRKAAVAIVGIVALGYGAHPSVGAIDGSTFLYSLMAVVGAYAGINVYQHRYFNGPPAGGKR